MNPSNTKFVPQIVLGIIAILLIGSGIYVYTQKVPDPQPESLLPVIELKPEPDTLIESPPITIQPSCVRGGCSSQLCVEETVSGVGPITTCEYRAEYACYKQATCERQASGSCGWTKTIELKACLSNPPAIQ